VVLCGKVPVPLDRTGRVPGTIDIYTERARARDLPAKAAGAAARSSRWPAAPGNRRPSSPPTSSSRSGRGSSGATS
jgi:hypothetical protein